MLSDTFLQTFFCFFTTPFLKLFHIRKLESKKNIRYFLKSEEGQNDTYNYPFFSLTDIPQKLLEKFPFCYGLNTN